MVEGARLESGAGGCEIVTSCHTFFDRPHDVLSFPFQHVTVCCFEPTPPVLVRSLVVITQAVTVTIPCQEAGVLTP